MDKTMKRQIGYKPEKKSTVKETKPAPVVKLKAVPPPPVKKKSKRGGARPGAGRPAGEPTTFTGFSIPTANLEEIKAKIKKLIEGYKK